MVSRTKLLRFTASHSQCSRMLSTLSPNHLQGSYVAVSGTPGRGSVHVVEGVPALAGGSVTVVNGVRVCFSKCFYNIHDSYCIFFHRLFQSVSHHGGSRVAAIPHHPLPQVAFQFVLAQYGLAICWVFPWGFLHVISRCTYCHFTYDFPVSS